MANIAELLSARAAIPAARGFTNEPESTDLMDTLSSVGGAGLGAVASVGNFLDLPGSSVRDLLAGRNPLDQWTSPLSSENRTSGRDLLEMYGMRKNRETGMMGWLSDPGEGLRDLAGFGAEVVLDPFGPATKALMAGSAAGRALTTAAGRAHPLVRKLGGAAKYAFDTLPENITRGILTQAGKATRGVKSLFNAPSAGITDPFVMPMAEQARTAAKAYRETANLHVSELANSARVNKFNLIENPDLDMTDPANIMRDDSPVRVRARMDAERRAFEGIYDPNEGGLLPNDVVSMNNKTYQIERIDRSPNGTKVKLVGDDNLYDDFQLEPLYQQMREVIPEPHLALIQQMRSLKDSWNQKLKSFGAGESDMVDPYIDYFHRRKSDELRRLEQIGGLNTPSWARSNHQSLIRTLNTSGGRDMVYRAFKEGTPAVNELMNNPTWKSVIDRIDADAVPDVNGLKILPGYVGKSHIDDIAQVFDRTPDELWEEMWLAQPVSKTGTFAYAPQEGLYHVVDQGMNQKGMVTAQRTNDVVDLLPNVDPAAIADGSFDDALHFIERDLAGKGTASIRMTATPEIGDVLKKRGYVGTGGEGAETWTKKINAMQPGTDPKYSMPTHVTKEQFKTRLQEVIAAEQNDIANGAKQGYQPGRGWWKSWTELRPNADGSERVLNLDLSKTQLAKVDLPTLDALRQTGGFRNITDYDVARAALESGKEVHLGWRPATKGRPAEFVMVTPTQRSKVVEQATKKLSTVDQMIDERPLTAKEVIHDELHQGITRNYKDKVDQWMPTLDDRGNAVAVGQVADDVHAETVQGWHKTVLDGDIQARIDEGKNLTKPQRSLLRLSDESLEALLLPPVVRQQIADMRAKAGITQDMSIGIEDRHRALAIETADHVEKRYSKLYESWAPKSGHDYLAKAGSKVAYFEALRDNLTNLRSRRDMFPDTFGTGVSPNNVQTTLDLKAKMGMSFEEALDAGFFSGAVNKNTFLENMRQHWIGQGFFKEVDDPKEVAKQLKEILSLRAPADTWSQMKTLNEGVTMFDLPELDTPKKMMSSLMSLTKSGYLSYSPATAIRDGLSSAVNAVVMGDMSPLAYMKKAKSAWSFSNGAVPLDIPEGVAEIEQHLAARSIPSTPRSRGEAFQNFWNAHHMSGSIHPNVVTADAMRMAESDSPLSVLGNQPGNTSIKQEFLGGLQRTVQAPGVMGKVKEAILPAGTYVKDDLGRWVQKSTSGPIVAAMNGLRSKIDNLNRAVFVMDRLDKTKSLADAFEASDKFLLNADPQNFTRFEHQYMKTFFPFYSFMRQTIPMYMTELMVNPGGKLGNLIRATRLGQGDEKGYVPYQYQDSAAIPLGKTDDGNIKYLTSFGLMHEDAVKYAGNALQMDLRGLMQQAAASSNPAMKWFIEHSTNTSLFSQGPMGGRRLDDLDPSIGRLLTNLGLQDAEASGRATPFGSPTLESLAAAGPASRILSMAKIASDTRTGVGEKVLRLLSGVRIENVTPEQITRDLRDRLNAIQIASGARPLTIVSGSEKLVEHLKATGQPETAAVLERINKALAAQRRAVAAEDKPTNSRTVVDMLRQAQ